MKRRWLPFVYVTFAILASMLAAHAALQRHPLQPDEQPYSTNW